jgi:phospholipid transport system substrate-binding protein
MLHSAHSSLRLSTAIILAGLFNVSLVKADQAQDSPRQVVEHTIDDAFKILRDERLRSDSARRMHELRGVVDRSFDWGRMAQSSLGAPWRDLTPVQRTEFVNVFKELLAQRYMDDIDRFEGSEDMTVTGVEQLEGQATVKTQLLTSSKQKIPIDYTLHATQAHWRVDDVTIEGVSLVNHYRKTFANYLANKTFQELLQQLKRKLGTP